jgi:hypothetical protein
MVIAKSLDKNYFLYADHTDNTEFFLKNGKESV